MSARLAYRSFEDQEAVVAECHARLDAWRTPHESRIVQTALGPTTVVVAGGASGHNGRSRPVLVLPGANLAAAALLPLATAIARSGRQVLVADLPGQAGLSYPKRPPNLGAYGAWLDELLTSLDRRPTLVAHAFGAAVALLASPERVADLVLVNPAGVIPARSLRRATGLALAELSWRLRPAPHTARTFAQRLAAPGTVVRDDTVRWLELVSTHARPVWTPAPVGDDVVARWAAPGSAPVRVLAGVHDPRFPPDDLARAASLLGLATTLVQGAGHLLPDERPDAVVAALG